MKPRGRASPRYVDFTDPANYKFLKEAKDLLSKLHGVSGVTNIASMPICKSSKKRPYVAAIQQRGEGYVIVRYFAPRAFQDMQVECDISSVGRVELAVMNYVSDFAAARNRRRMLRGEFSMGDYD